MVNSITPEVVSPSAARCMQRRTWHSFNSLTPGSFFQVLHLLLLAPQRRKAQGMGLGTLPQAWLSLL